ncbi:MAG: CCA tRNA nucleotidyltransferase [Bdellovibrio sp.]
MDQVRQLLQSHPHWPVVEAIYHKLTGHGYKAFLAGGCVRDALLGIMANDLDIATDATPDTIEKLFVKTINVGKTFGVMRVVIEGADIEVATFRNDGDYKDGRRPEHVVFSTPEEDAERRDFTVNALFYDLQRNQVLDYVNGRKDLEQRILKTVGDPAKRFQEDQLRLLRGARFAAQLGFTVVDETKFAMKQMAQAVLNVSGERIREEMSKLLKAKNVQAGLDVMDETNLMKVLFPWRAAHLVWRSYGATEAWQNLSLFLSTATANDLKQSLDLLKLSTKERRGIEDACGLWENAETFMKLRRGEQLQQLQKPGKEWALDVLSKKGQFVSEIKTVMEDKHSWGPVLPKPFLNGEDLRGQLAGEAIGQCLQEALRLQLERQLQSREEALLWLKKYLKD